MIETGTRALKTDIMELSLTWVYYVKSYVTVK